MAMLGYKATLYRRIALKNLGMRLFVGGIVDGQTATKIAAEFAMHILATNIAPGARQAIKADQSAGAMLLMATAASELYAGDIATALGFADCLSTRQARNDHGAVLAQIDGENNYGAEKLRRVEAWVAAQGWQRTQLHITAYSDHISDAPLLNWADKAVLVGNHHAPIGNWEAADWR
jgi:phosphatidylglycerophosphatase C